VGLCPPTVNLDDGGTYRSSKTQRWLWSCWLDFCEKVNRLPGRKVALLNGDIGELDTKRRSYQIVTPNKATILDMALNTLMPLLEVVNDVVVVRGTLAHVGKSAWLEEAIARDLDNAITPNGDSAPFSHWHVRRVVSGVRFDIAHHATMGRLHNTEKNAANKIAVGTLYRYKVDMEQQAPDVVIRSHNHRYASSGDNYPLFAICSPCWTTATEFVYRVSQENTLASIGGLAFVCYDGEYQYHKYLYDYPKASLRWKNL